MRKLSTLLAVIGCVAALLAAHGAYAQVQGNPNRSHEVVVKKKDGTYERRSVSGDPSDEAKRIEKKEPDVEVAGPYREAHLQQATVSGATPNDPLLPTQPNLMNGPMNFDSAWNAQQGASERVGIVDSGFQQDHPDLIDKADAQKDFISGDDVADPNGYYHGTATSSIAAASTDNSAGMAGAAWASKFVHARACTDVCPNTATAPAVDWLVSQGVRQISLSFGDLGYDDPVLKNSIANAEAADVVVVAAIGNNGVDVGSSGFGPACWPSVLAVGATTEDGTGWAGYSNYGACLGVAAPGSLITSAAIPNECGTDLYCNVTGTSFAAPHVAGTSALVRAQHPTWTQEEVVEDIVKEAKKKSLSGLPPDVSEVKVLSAKCAVKPRATGC